MRCRRPFIVSGGELTLQMLDLSFHPATKVYDSPPAPEGQQRHLPDR